jgi:hypothetical protein
MTTKKKKSRGGLREKAVRHALSKSWKWRTAR